MSSVVFKKKTKPKRTGHSKRFNSSEYVVSVVFEQIIDEKSEIKIDELFEEIEVQLEIALNDLFDENNLKPIDQIRIALTNRLLDFEIYIPFTELRYFSIDNLSNEIIKVSSSKRDFLLNDEFTLTLMYVRMPSVDGRSLKRKLPIDFDDYVHKSTKIIPIQPGYCILRAFIIGKAYADKIDVKERRKIRENTFQIQTKLLNELIQKIEINNDDELKNPFKILPKLESLYPEYRIIGVTPPKRIIYKGKNDSEKHIYIIIRENHAHLLLSMKSFLDYSYFCKKCLKGYSKKNEHRCENVCQYCHHNEECIKEEKTRCSDCLMFFASQKCLNNHKNVTRICGRLRFCEKCKRIVVNKNHFCGKKFCRICKKMVEILNHKCFVQKHNLEKLLEDDNRPRIYLFYDFESYIYTNEDGESIHTPNLCVTQTTCDSCWDQEKGDKLNLYCAFCMGKQKVFSGVNCVNEFVNYLFKDFSNFLREKRKTMKLEKSINTLVIAHNSRSYDMQFIVKYCLENGCIPKILKKGTKILSMEIQNFKFLDSLSFIPMALKTFAKTFGLGDQFIKGDFPHLFNKPENWFYNSKWPGIENYEIDKKSNDDREKFIKWYDTKKDEIFNFQEELEKYCKQDVKILMRGVMIFRDNWIKTSNLNPFSRNISLPMAVMESFRTTYLEANTIAVIPSKGYEPFRNISYKGQSWLDYLEIQNNCKIEREYKIGPYYADGFNPKTKEVYEFFGCYFHGCMKCYPKNRCFIENKVNNKDMSTLYKLTTDKLNYYKKEELIIIDIWECDFDIMVNNSEAMKQYYANHIRELKNRRFHPPIEPRNALYGGRVNASKLYHHVEKDEKIYYYDFTSLYPYVCKSKWFPIGHPKIIRNPNISEINQFEGLIYCKILPPRDLYFPVLPIKYESSLIYPLCFECAKNKLFDCFHNEDQRALLSTWTTIDIKLALKKKYKLLEIYEVWHFNDISRGSDHKMDGIFTKFINDCVKDKVESSGYPLGIDNETKQKDYIREYKCNENIDLNPLNISINPGRRAVAKLKANSFWGKWAQNSSLIKQTLFINEPDQFFKLLSDTTIEVDDAFLISEDCIQVQYRKKKYFLEESHHSNVVIASYVTAHARCELYKLLDEIGHRVLYYDTDSVIFTAKNNEFIPKTGYFLGMLTDEVFMNDDPERYITKFISLGPKNYSIEIFSPKTKKYSYNCKVKGLSLNFETSSIVNFDKMEQLLKAFVEQNQREQVYVPQFIIKTTNQYQVKSVNFNKIYRITYNKRILKPDYTTRPFGFLSV